jgi:hypothetical protein
LTAVVVLRTDPLATLLDAGAGDEAGPTRYRLAT